MPSSFPCSPVICERSWKKPQIKKKFPSVPKPILTYVNTCFFDNTPGKEMCYPWKIDIFFSFAFQQNNL